MAPKRKHGASDGAQQGDIVAKPAAGTKTFSTGVAVRDGLASGSRQAMVAFHQQILTPYSALPLPITHPTITILQHFQQASPTFDEIFNAWREGDKGRNERQVESAVSLLAHIIQLLTPMPFFRTAVLGVVKKLVSNSEPYPDLINRLVQSGKRDQVLIGVQLAAAAAHTDPPDPSKGPSHGTSGRLAIRVWSILVEGGSAKAIAKLLNMRRRNKEGLVDYGSKDPLDRPDIRHATLHLILPLLSLPAFHSHIKPILPAIYSNLQSDPAVTIYRVLTALWAAITGPSSGIARRSALALLDENAIESLLGLLVREDEDSNTGKAVWEISMSFLEGVTTVPGQGICFPDEGWYPRRGTDDSEGQEDGAPSGIGHWKDGKMRRGLHNRILSNVVRKVGGKVVDDQGRVGDWVIKVLHACPELVAGYWPHSALSLDPKLHPRWLATVSYVGRIISLPPPPLSTFYEPIPRGSDLTDMPPRTNPPTVNNMIESIFPSPLGKVHLTKGLQHAEHLVQHITALSLARGLQKLDLVWNIFKNIEAELELEPGSSENPWSKRRMELELECRRRVPDVLVVIAFAQKSATLARVPVDSEEEPDPALVARSAMLTEAALRLFGLYHRTLPSIAREAKFDVGKLLVSASSAKAEKREKRDAREGSVISDSGSVGSVGTIGTVGMGGGFGQARGDVDGFEAMSQVHVLSLLTEVRDFQWTNKAAGSQYSYLYHILILHLSTPHPITKRMTSLLLDRLLLSSIMFDHDQGELEIWLSALPNLSGARDITERAFLIAQQIHLLSFLDDCVRRCVKTPYRYIEDGLNLLPDHFDPTTRPHELVSPLLMTILEQLNAKIMGQLIATEAAGVVVEYLHRVILGLSGKMRDGQFLTVITERLKRSVREAREKGQERSGLLGSVSSISKDIGRIFGGDDEDMDVDEEPAVKMIDQESWIESSFESLLLNGEKEQDVFRKFTSLASPASLERFGRFAVHLLSSNASGSSTQTQLWVVRECLVCCKTTTASRLRRAVFETSSVKTLLLSSDKNDTDVLVATLRQDDRTDRALAEVYVHALLEKMRKDKKGKKVAETLAIIHPWTRFFSSDNSVEAIDLIVKNIKRLSDPSPRVKQTISALITSLSDPSYALGQLGHFVIFGIISPFTTLLETSVNQKGRMDALPKFEISETTVKQLVSVGTTDSYGLLRTLVEVSPSAVIATTSALQAEKGSYKNRLLLHVLSSLLNLKGAITPEQYAEILDNAVEALKQNEQSDTAIRVISAIAEKKEGATLLATALQEANLPAYGAPLAKLTLTLAANKSVELIAPVLGLVHYGLKYITRACSSGKPLDEDHFSIIGNIAHTLRERELDLNSNLVEPVITAVIQDRLDIPQATSFAALLVEKAMLKASFIRQHLSLLYSSSTYLILASPTTTATPIRTGFVHLLSALFSSNPYVACIPDYLEQLLPIYRGTLGISDRRLLSLFQLFEGYRHISTISVLSAWSGGGGTSKRAFEALTSLETGKVFATCLSFPIKNTLRSETKSIVGKGKPNEGEGEGESLYDPAFVVPLFAAVLREPLTGLDWVEILRTNVLGLTVSCLSARDKELRSVASYVLARTFAILETTRFQERAQLIYVVRLIRHSIPAPPSPPSPVPDSSEIPESSAYPSTSSKQPRLPALITLFLAHVLRTLASPSNSLYADSSRFLLQRSVFDAEDVPMLFGMLYASAEGYKRDRAWIVRLIRDGSRTDADWRLLKRRKTVQLLQTMYQSATDLNLRKLILQAMESITQIAPACLSIAHRNAFLTWLNIQWIASASTPTRSAEEERSSYLTIAENLVIVLVSRNVAKAADVAAAGAVDAEDRAAGDKGRDQQRDWVKDAERLIDRACDDADLDRLEVLSRMTLRLTALPNSTSAERTLPALLDRLRNLRPGAAGNATNDKAYSATVENLFRMSLTLSYGGEGKLRETVNEIGWRVSAMQGQIGDWVRKQRRSTLWETYQRRH